MGEVGIPSTSHPHPIHISSTSHPHLIHIHISSSHPHPHHLLSDSGDGIGSGVKLEVGVDGVGLVV